jgi:hypothetical protein
VYNQYKAIRDGLKAEIREQKSENVVRNENEWMSLDELKAVPDLVKKEIEIKYGSLFLPKTRLSQMKKAERDKYIKLFLNWGFIYIVINHPLRLDYYNLRLTKADDSTSRSESMPSTTGYSNYMVRSGKKLTLHLNKFKNVKSLGPQVIEYNDLLILKYLDQLEVIFGKKPDYLLWMVLKNEIKLFSRKEVYSHHISNIIKKYTDKHISNNTIRIKYDSIERV